MTILAFLNILLSAILTLWFILDVRRKIRSHWPAAAHVFMGVYWIAMNLYILLGFPGLDENSRLGWFGEVFFLPAFTMSLAFLLSSQIMHAKERK